LAAYGVTADLVAEQSSGEGLAAALLSRLGSVSGRRMLWPRSNIAGRAMHDRLTAAGAAVVDPEAYRTEPVRPGALELFVSDLAAGRIDAVAFLSPSSAQGLATALDGSLRTLHGHTQVAAIGPTTAAALAHLGAPAALVPAAASATGLAEAIMRRLAKSRVTR
jgi:uroporphyrinogen-III synthase